MTMQKISVLGGGAWGTALAQTCARAGRDVALWEQEADNAESLASKRESRFLPGVRLDDKIKVTRALGEASRADAILLAVPAQAMRSVVKSLAQTTGDSMPLVACAKGIEAGTHKFMTEVIAECAPRALPGILSGPSFAIDVARGLPTAVTVALGDESVARDLATAMNTGTFRPYHANDVRGVELGGALKNVIALAAGVTHGLNLGHNSAAALITRGMAEMTRLAVACGARRQTLAGLSGIGDLVLTCTGPLSRNRAVGIELGRGRQLPDILSGLHGKVAEGVHTTTAALGLAARYSVEMPITEQMNAILHHNRSPKDAIRELMSRPGRDE